MIHIAGLTKTFPGGARALAGIDLDVAAGEILALLGPNGAGKTTMVRVLTTLCGFDEGKVLVAGHDVDIEPEKVRQAIGYVAQDTGVDYFLTGRENLVLQGQLYRMTRADIRARIIELADYFDLSKHLDKLVATYSGGMRRKLDIAMALLHRPKVLFLDEPTLGLDTPSRQSLWQYVKRLNVDLGLTILLTTHYLDEADKLAHRVAIIDAGKIQVIDTPNSLKDTIKGDAITLETVVAGTNGELDHALKQIPGVQDVRREGVYIHLYAEQGASLIPRVIETANHLGVEVKNLNFARPTLDDVFIRYTGASMTRAKESGGNEWWRQWAGKGGSWQKQWQGDESESASAATWNENSEQNDNQDWKKWQQQWSGSQDSGSWGQQENVKQPTQSSAWPSQGGWTQPESQTISDASKSETSAHPSK